MKVLFSIIGAIIGIALLMYLYEKQLGAVSFLIVAIVFFTLSYRQFTKRENHHVQNRTKKQENHR